MISVKRSKLDIWTVRLDGHVVAGISRKQAFKRLAEKLGVAHA